MGELWGLQEGLFIVKNCGFNKVFVETVSETMVQVLSKGDHPSPITNTLVTDCIFLISQFHICKTTHIFREGNQCADFLVNLGQNTTQGLSILDHPPGDLNELLQRDASGIATSRRR